MGALHKIRLVFPLYYLLFNLSCLRILDVLIWQGLTAEVWGIIRLPLGLLKIEVL